MNGYERLANAIIGQAAEDYRIAYRAFLRNPANRQAQKSALYRRSFASILFETLTNADGQFIIKGLRQMESTKERTDTT